MTFKKLIITAWDQIQVRHSPVHIATFQFSLFFLYLIGFVFGKKPNLTIVRKSKSQWAGSLEQVYLIDSACPLHPTKYY